ncbi:thiol-disulfide isomerase/thioredoxin [Tenacibaculum adriaticum]|uniref:Thiol-disulfide isomerase/thioredoxin n=1 Tax=Tenacibaculum adriaticum TaxID=413713 RepID=A0A5S5DUD4_9FLAO|nr:redoxin family protein [Tenacibaculum adriaticum]TYP99570.1 thiol-disulfide isomerase/thioredoxin [Tenacibaculum adriaticum]
MFRNLLLICIVFLNTNTFSQENFKVGDNVPEFKLWLTDGSRLTKNDILNKVVVFKFWFTYCIPCLLDINKLNELVISLDERNDILFIAPALERKEIIEEFTSNTAFLFKIAYSAMDVSQIFNKKQVYPSYFVIDKKGKFTYIDSGIKKSEFIPLKKAILKALKE